MMIERLIQEINRHRASANRFRRFGSEEALAWADYHYQAAMQDIAELRRWLRLAREMGFTT